MTATLLTFLTRRRMLGVTAALLAAVLGGCSIGGPGDRGLAGSTGPTASVSASPPAAVAGVRVVLRFGGHLASATLAETPAAREFAAMLPLTVELTDRMGQAKFGRLPRPLDLTGAPRVFATAVGEIAYWSPGDTLAIVYGGVGPVVPDPGLVQIGVVNVGLDELADTGNRTSVRIDLATEPGA
jgi:hypothetical protein